MKKVLVIDTSILCVWLDIPGMEDCGPDADKWNRARVAAKIEAEERENTTFVLPLASIIETGNHIAQARNYRRERGESLAELIRKSANQDTPWAAFSDQSTLWTSVKLTELADSWRCSLYVLGLIYTYSKFAGLRCPLWIPPVFLNCFAPLPN